MVKKILKYLKFTVSIILIFSLVLPLYAANAASDGSAFVTKEEFDKSLADFNTRLTTFEAGINSKIDSQVSSYLDRNGIWNGVKQTLVSSTLYVNACEMFNIPVDKRIDYTGYTQSGAGGKYNYPTWDEMINDPYVKDRPAGTYDGYYTFRPDSGGINVWFIEWYLGTTGGSTPSSSYCFPQDLFVANKSGLVFATVRQNKIQTTCIQYSLTAKTSGNQSWYADHSDSVDIGYAFVVNDEYKVRKSLWSLTASGSDFYSATSVPGVYYGGYNPAVAHSGGSKAYTVPISRYDSIDNFFVQKGDRVQFAPSPIINMNSSHNNHVCTFQPKSVVPTTTAGTWPSTARWEFSFSDVSVY